MKSTEQFGGKKEFRYESVIHRVMDMIGDGRLVPGDKIPSLRKLSASMGVSLSTAIKAFSELERLGFIESRPQSGYYVKRTVAKEAPLPEQSNLSKKPQKSDKFSLISSTIAAMTDPDIVPLGGAVPCPSLLPGQELARIMRTQLNRTDIDYNRYEYITGSPALKKQLAYYLLEAGMHVHPDELVITNGASEAISIALRAITRPGDVIMVESPTYFGLIPMFEVHGLYALEIPVDYDTGIDTAQLEKAVDRYDVKAFIFQPNFSNPSGTLTSDEKKKEIVRILLEKNIPIIEDDMYGDLAFSGKRPDSLVKYDTKGLVMHCSSMTKIVGGGYRVGWIRPGRFYEEVVKLKFSTSVATAKPVQLVIAEYLASGKYLKHINKLRSAFSRQIATFSSKIQECFPQGTKISRPAGGFILWVEMPEGKDSYHLYLQAMENGIGFTPGTIFSTHDWYENCFRLNCGHPWSPRIENAIVKLGEMAKTL